jgi:hypothetical protein
VSLLVISVICLVPPALECNAFCNKGMMPEFFLTQSLYLSNTLTCVVHCLCL